MFKRICIMTGIVTAVIMVIVALQMFVMKPVSMNMSTWLGKMTGSQEILDKSGYTDKLVYQDKQYELARVYKDTDEDANSKGEYIEYIFTNTGIGYGREKSIVMTFKLDDIFKKSENILVLTEENIKSLLVDLE